MGRLRNIKCHNTLEEIRSLLKKSISNDFKLRLLVLEKIISDSKITTSTVCQMFFIETQTLSRWLKWYNEGGLEKLKNGNGGKGSNSGRKNLYSKEMFECLVCELDKQQNVIWTLEKMRSFLKLTFKSNNKDIPTIQAIHYRLKKEYPHKYSSIYLKEVVRDSHGKFQKIS